MKAITKVAGVYIAVTINFSRIRFLWYKPVQKFMLSWTRNKTVSVVYDSII